MPDSEAIQEALETNSGARFFRCALQVNPHHYGGSYRGQEADKGEEEFVDAVLSEAEAAGIEVLALTDHNHSGGVEEFSRKAAEKGIIVFPGFEVTSLQGVHYLCLFDPGTPEDVLARYLGGIGIDETGPNVSLSNMSGEELTAFVVSHSGLVIAAHVTTEKGLLATLTGEARAKAWKDPNLHCAQIPGGIDDLPMKYRQIVQNKDLVHSRSPAPEGQAMAIVNAKDVVDPRDLSDPAATCMIKMTEPSIEALRQAFLDPESRIRSNSDPVPPDHIRLVAMAWEGGFLDGLRIRFSENLTSIIGGRGTGKSTIVESLRYVLEISPVGPEAEKNHKGIIKDVLRPGTTVSLLLYSPHPSPKQYTIVRTQPRPAKVLDQNGDELALRPKDIVPTLQVLGQHEIGELTRDPRLTAELFGRFVADTSNLDGMRESLRQRLEENRAEIHRLERQVESEAKKLLRLPGLQEKLSQYKAAGFERKTKEKTVLDSEEQAIDAVVDQLEELDGIIFEFREELEVDTEVAPEGEDKETPGAEFLDKLSRILKELEKSFKRGAKGLEAAATTARKKIDDVVKEWTEERADPVNAEYDRLLKKLKAESVDTDEFVRLQKQVNTLGPIKKKLSQSRRKLTTERNKRPPLVEEWSLNGAAFLKLHEEAAKRVSRQLKGIVRLTLNPEGDREPFFKALRDEVGGRLHETIDEIEELGSFSISDFVASCRSGSGELQTNYNLTENQAGLIVEADEAFLLKLEELHLPHTAELELNVSGDPKAPEWRPMSRLSTGQKATAALLLLLLETDAPLIVDQPEDDLDNRFIANVIVPSLRKEKLRRQFVFCTHNANLPVLGDAELILAMDAEGDAESGVAEIPEAWRGSIDCPEIQEVVEDILEGGKAAFETRRRKYGF